ncbi:hypothetical protein SAMN02745121_08211 [Nannocystis exedens]|uniref:Uncharacterized protein n=1 Tax=Nannocystis exedens TaxID=54 RepID=A0A1I2HTZ5_9BACT|nr:hypothetical protein [Nannocystis exedens]PCC73188.1 hypothetical protein NAEX_06276 [Nannocystis exedens]SFF33359.1 hypothetical protein SAMN02745121_08211 [Nannocystis exedens]
MSSRLVTILTGVGTLAVGGAILAYSRSASASTSAPQKESGTTPKDGKPSTTAPLEWDNALPLPTAKEVKGDLDTNWGSTPKDLRPLLLLAEEASGIVGAGRILAVIAKRESAGFVVTAHNGDEVDEQAERDASRKAYERGKATNPALSFGEAAADFGSGGLFGALAPYFLWTGVAELGAKAPLLGADPRMMFLPRVATFAAMVYLQRLLDHYQVDDHGDIKAGWASPSLLVDPPKGGRGEETYTAVRERFYADAKSLGVNLSDAATIPAKLSAATWPGVQAMFDRLVGVLPTPRKAKV